MKLEVIRVEKVSSNRLTFPILLAGSYVKARPYISREGYSENAVKQQLRNETLDVNIRVKYKRWWRICQRALVRWPEC